MGHNKRQTLAKSILYTLTSISFLLSTSGCGESLHKAIQSGDTEKAESLLSKTNVNKYDLVGYASAFQEVEDGGKLNHRLLAEPADCWIGCS